jgi:allophanate hydrolase subunit 1
MQLCKCCLANIHAFNGWKGIWETDVQWNRLDDNKLAFL